MQNPCFCTTHVSSTLPSKTLQCQSALGCSRANRPGLFKLDQSPVAVQTFRHPAKGCCQGQRAWQKCSLGIHLPPSPCHVTAVHRSEAPGLKRWSSGGCQRTPGLGFHIEEGSSRWITSYEQVKLQKCNDSDKRIYKVSQQFVSPCPFLSSTFSLPGYSNGKYLGGNELCHAFHCLKRWERWWRSSVQLKCWSSSLVCYFFSPVGELSQVGQNCRQDHVPQPPWVTTPPQHR